MKKETNIFGINSRYANIESMTYPSLKCKNLYGYREVPSRKLMPGSVTLVLDICNSFRVNSPA